MRDRDVQFHETWLGLAQPIEGLMFSVPVLADAQIAPEVPRELAASFEAQLTNLPDAPRLRSLPTFLREFLGYDQPGMLVTRDDLPRDLSYPSEGGQEIRPSFALARGPFQPSNDDPFALFAEPTAKAADVVSEKSAPVTASTPYFALIWDLTESAEGLDLDRPENVTGAWRYPPTMKFERLLRHVGIPIGLLSNGENLRLIYAPAGETTAHLTFRLKELQGGDGRPVQAALDLLLHARRAYTASAPHTLEGLLAESRRRQADVTSRLASQVFEAVEILVAGFEAAANRDATGGRLDWLRAALEADDDHFYQGVLSVVLRLVFLLYAEDQSLLPVGNPTYAQHLSLLGLYERLAHDAGAHPESMHHRFGAYGQMLALFRAVFFGVKHGDLELPPRHGKLFDPNAFPFLEGGQPDWTAAVQPAAARAAVQPASLDDGTIYRVMHRLMVFEGQRLSYRTLDVEQIGSVYESLMGYHVLRLGSPAVRLGKHGVWVEAGAILGMSAVERGRFLKETCGLASGPILSLEAMLKDVPDEGTVLEALSAHAVGRHGAILRHRAGFGHLVLQPGEERRRTGSHYTPRSLTEKVVRRTLEPILACLGEQRTVDQILELKICDPAMGSGAFLVAACRQLADEIVVAWTRASELVTVTQQYGDAHLHARRLVAQRCLYGVDKNAAAVELAKLSLWLVTLSRTLPFTFVDHALRHGDSLVGLDFQQIRTFHWNPSKQVAFCEKALTDALEQALVLRQQILALAEKEDPAAQEEKRRLLEFSRQAVDRIRLVADVCVGAFFSKANDRERETERSRRLSLVEEWLGGDESLFAGLDEMAAEVRKALPPFHWWIEFPEVFFEERPDPLQGGAINRAAAMEAVVGNPPFAGKNTINDIGGELLVAWLKVVSPGGHGNADLCAHFFRRGAAILGSHGSLSFIATNTISQGDTRTTSLAALVREGFLTTAADTTVVWPGAAAVVVSLVSLARGSVTQTVCPVLDGTPVATINSRLKALPEREEPSALVSNESIFSQGTILHSMGFVIDSHERSTLLSKNPVNVQRIRPYIGGEEVTHDPRQSFTRYVIDIDNLTVSDAEDRWPDLVEIVRARVKPDRDRLKNNPIGLRQKKYWWRFWASRADLYARLALLSRCLVTAISGKHRSFTWQPTDRVLDQTLIVFPFEKSTQLSVLQSRVHETWSVHLSATIKEDQRYNPSRAVSTFPFPKRSPFTTIPELESIGDRLHEKRAAFMRDTQQGLTKSYNSLKDPMSSDPRIFELRQLHEEVDRAVLAAYGWSEVRVPPFCIASDADRAAVRAFEDEVIDRLYLLNAERAREEQRLGAAQTKPKKSGRGKKTPSGQGDLF